MKIFSGLGNPGAAYALNRHNIGFMAVDAIAALHGFGPWKTRFQGLASEGRIGTDKITLLKAVPGFILKMRRNGPINSVLWLGYGMTFIALTSTAIM